MIIQESDNTSYQLLLSLKGQESLKSLAAQDLPAIRFDSNLNCLFFAVQISC